MTPLERAAQAIDSVWVRKTGPSEYIVLHDGEPASGTATTPQALDHELNIVRARAVLQAIREPSERMAREGAYAIPAREEEGPTNPGDARDCWETMIDAALEEG